MEAPWSMLPRPALVVDGALRVLAYSERALALFGMRRGRDVDLCGRLGEAIAADPPLGDALALATARLLRPGEEERLAWERGEGRYEVTICLAAPDGSAFVVLFDDTTQQALSEEIMSNARSYLEHVLNDIPIGVAVLNSELRVTAVNPCQLRFLARLGAPATLVDAIGATLAALAPDGPGPSWQILCEQVLRTGQRQEQPKQAWPASAGELVLAAVATPLMDARGRNAGAILVTDDVTEQSRLERELVRVEKLATVGQMVVAVNHEINNPLNIIANNAQALRLLNPDLDARIVAKLVAIEEQVKRIAAVTERLRTMEAVTTSEYIADGPRMIDVWGKRTEDGR
jgi:nitrogen fixation/metabolism regulation signal transduction histidine kinase